MDIFLNNHMPDVEQREGLRLDRNPEHADDFSSNPSRLVFATNGVTKPGMDYCQRFFGFMIQSHQRKFGDEIPRLLELLQRGSVAPEGARLTFSTAHRAKGLEWDCVRLLDDFLDPADKELQKELEPQVLAEETNILYVAITRARLKIKYPVKLLEWFHAQSPESRDARHRFPPESTDSASAGNIPVSKPPTRPAGAAGSLDLPEISRRIANIRLTKITKNLHPNLRDTRRQYPRAYEPWGEAEDALLRRAWALEPDPVQLAAVFRRNVGAVSSRAGHLGLD